MESFSPRYIYWELTSHCNLHCKHCFAKTKEAEVSTADQVLVKEKIEELQGSGKFSIRFGGGEPFLVPYLFDLISFCTYRNIDVDITTNGILYNEIFSKKLQIAGLRELTFSIDGLEKQHDFLRGNGTFQKTIHSLSHALTQNKYRVSVACTIHAKNYQEIEDFTSFIIQLGIKKIYFFRYCPNENSGCLLLSSIQLKCVSNTIKALKEKYPNIIFVCEKSSFYTHYAEIEGCNFLRDIISINYKGDVVVCAAINKVIANIFCQPLDIVFQKIEHEKMLMQKIPEDCFQCLYKTVCHGGCKSNSFSMDCTYSTKDIFCYKEECQFGYP